MTPLDSFDRAILRILQRDNTTPQRNIGAAVNLSAPSVQRRIRRMEEEIAACEAFELVREIVRSASLVKFAFARPEIASSMAVPRLALVMSPQVPEFAGGTPGGTRETDAACRPSYQGAMQQGECVRFDLNDLN